MFDKLAGLEARFLLSFDDCAEIRKLAKERGFVTKEVDVQYTLSHAPGSRSKMSPELLIANFPI